MVRIKFSKPSEWFEKWSVSKYILTEKSKSFERFAISKIVVCRISCKSCLKSHLNMSATIKLLWNI